MIKVNVGSGPTNFGDDWIHIDERPFPHVKNNDYALEEFDDRSVDLIYSSHFLEYFDRDSIKDILIEWKLTLKENGIVRIAVPDFEAMAELYVNGQYPLDSFLGPLYGKMPMSDVSVDSGLYIFHKTTFDFESLKKMLKEVGFRQIRRWDWEKVDHGHIDDCSQAYLPHMDKKNGILISLNMEAIR